MKSVLRQRLAMWHDAAAQLACRGCICGLVLACALSAVFSPPVAHSAGKPVPGKFVPVPKIRPLSVRPVKPLPAEKPVSGGESADPQPDTSCEMEWGEFEPVAPVMGEGGCGFGKAVSMEAVKAGSGIRFSPQPVLTCAFGKTVSEWLARDVAPLSSALLGEEIDTVEVGPGYSCRLRNNANKGKISEHALGKALDISAFVLKSGKRVSVADDWTKEAVGPDAEGRFLQAAHTAACQRFTTVLGPQADEHHRSHFHLDTGCHGKSCTYLICQ